MTSLVIQPPSLPDPRPRFSQGLLTEGERLLFIAGQTAVDKNNNVVGKGDIDRQAEQVFANLEAVLREAGATFDNLMMTTAYLTSIEYREAYNRIRLRYYRHHCPVSTLLIVAGLANPYYLI
jgi:2-iminobutanoate/2-iminopropanoate deaminase